MIGGLFAGMVASITFMKNLDKQSHCERTYLVPMVIMLAACYLCFLIVLYYYLDPVTNYRFMGDDDSAGLELDSFGEYRTCCFKLNACGIKESDWKYYICDDDNALQGAVVGTSWYEKELLQYCADKPGTITGYVNTAKLFLNITV